jgi:hypothetical protein
MRNSPTFLIEGEPTDQFKTDARRIVTDPEQNAGRPLLRRLAWGVLMAERGYKVDQARITQMQTHQISA